jgi:uncharacterized protein
MPAQYITPGVYREDRFPAPPTELRTGVPAFIGLAEREPKDGDLALTCWPQFATRFGAPPEGSSLAAAVRGFFANGGQLCYVARLDPTLDPWLALERCLERLAPLNTIDLVCAPDLSSRGHPAAAEYVQLQQALLAHCDRLGDRFAILDGLPQAGPDALREQRDGLHGSNGALYVPWIGVAAPGAAGGLRWVPPCGHIAGVYARSDQRAGVHKAPANEVLEEALDLQLDIDAAAQGPLNQASVNCLRAFPGRGIRVWGAHTLSPDPAWVYVSVRRLFLTAGRWIERNLAGIVFEPNDTYLWARIERELSTYCAGLFQQGALRGSTPQEAFYVRCNAAINPPEARERGEVVAEIGLAPGLPNEFVVVRITHSASGVSLSGPTPA